MRSTWISGFYRFSTRKAGSLDIFRFRISRSDDFGIGPFLESNPPPTTVKPSGNVDPGITEIKTSFKFKRRDSKEASMRTTVNPSRARYAVFCWRRLSPFDELQPRRTRPNFETRYSQWHPSGAGKRL